MLLLNYNESFSLMQINGEQNTTFQFSVNIIFKKMHEATLKLVLTQRQYVDRSY